MRKYYCVGVVLGVFLEPFSEILIKVRLLFEKLKKMHMFFENSEKFGYFLDLVLKCWPMCEGVRVVSGR